MATPEAILLKNRQFPIASESEVIAVRRWLKQTALEAGLDDRFIEEVLIAVSELAFNILRHAGRGQIEIRILQRDEELGVEVLATDNGQGIEDITAALTDGFSTAGGLGCGLGAVNRLMDQMDIVSMQQGVEGPSGVEGTRIRCVRWMKTGTEASPNPGDIGILSRPKPGERLNGDSYLVIDDGDSCLAAVIDGVGHGHPAHQASMAVRHYIETHSREPLDQIITGAAYACQSTRGAVVSIVRFNWVTMVLEQAGVGNIETRILPGDTTGATTLVSRRGFLGMGVPSVHINRRSWNRGDLLVMCSDGLSSSWEWQQFPEARLLPAQQFARELFDATVRGDDDATVLAVKFPLDGNTTRRI